MKSNNGDKSQGEEFDSNSDDDSCSKNSDDLMNYENNRKIPKFNLEEYERQTKEQEELLCQQSKGRRGIGNYDVYCTCFNEGSGNYVMNGKPSNRYPIRS